MSGSRVAGNKIEALGKTIAEAPLVDEPAEVWKGMLADLEKLAEFDEERDGADKRPEAPALLGAD